MQIDPYNRFYRITPSDTVNFPWGPCEALVMGSNGKIQVVAQDGYVTEFDSVKGDWLPIKAIRINATDTTATHIVALYRQ